MSCVRGVCVLAALALVLAAGPARGGEIAISPEAKRHVDLGVQHYEAQRWQEAVTEFELAYRLSHRPALLFNIARCEAKLGHDVEAIAFLRRYLEEKPDAPDAASVLSEIEAREQSLANAKGKQQAEAEAANARKRAEALQLEQARRDEERLREASAPKVVVTAPPPEAPRRSRGMRNAGIALLVVGPVMAIVGIALGAVAHDAANQVTTKTGMPAFGDCCSALESRGKASDSAGIALDVVGGAAAVAGAVTLGLSYRGRF